MLLSRTVIQTIAIIAATSPLCAADEVAAKLESSLSDSVQPFLKQFCFECHGANSQEAKLDLTQFATAASVANGIRTWELVRERLEAGEMPPEDAEHQPAVEQRNKIIEWFREFRLHEAQRTAGDPGPLTARRLSNAEYNYTIRDLTGQDIRPTREFPVDPANEAGFDNSSESLSMSPALLAKYLSAAREVVEHLVLNPDGLAFAPHPVVTDTDRDKYCVGRIIDFYQRQPTDYARYFFAAWRFEHRVALGMPSATVEEIAKTESISSKYLPLVWKILTDSADDYGPIARLRSMWRELPKPALSQSGSAADINAARTLCEAMRDFVVQLRSKLEPTVENLNVREVHKGSQPLVLWKNRQYAANRRKVDMGVLQVEGEPPKVIRKRSDRENRVDDESRSDLIPVPRDPDLVIPAEPARRASFEAAFQRFCDVFPDAFFISERGRDYVGKPKAEQEKGRLLSAGFHSMMGYFRDDGPLYELILDAHGQHELDALWKELDFIASAPMRQYTGFVWFERTDSRFMRDEEFDFARAEDKDVTSEAKIKRLAEVYLDKARRGSEGDIGLGAISDYFQDLNSSIRWIEQARLVAEPSHLKALQLFAERAFRRPLLSSERDELLSFYRLSRDHEGLSHEEAIQDAIVYVLMSPQFCYRMDLASADAASRPLNDYELASRLSYFLWSTMPDEELLTRAATGRLHQSEEIVSQTHRMLRNPKIRGLAVEFGGNWLGFRRFEEHNSVDRGKFPSFTNELRQAMFEEPVHFFEDLIYHNRSVLECLYADYTFVNATLAEHYGIQGLDIEGNEWVKFDRAESIGRGGLLPMSVFLTQNSPGLRTSPVKRGYWVTRRLLGERIAPPPPGVPDLPNDETKLGDLTLPEMLALHRAHKSCAGCHDRFDAVGVAFEGFGPIGERRTRDLGGRQIEITAVFPDGMERSGLAGLSTYLRAHRQQDFLDNLTRKMLSYGLGRSLLPADDLVLSTTRAKLESTGYQFSSLIESIVTSHQFLNKRGPTIPVE